MLWLILCLIGCFLVPKAALKDIDTIQMKFWCGHQQADHNRLCLKKWKDICDQIECGGLGIRSLGKINEYMLRKLA